MTTLKHAFDAQTLKLLVLKILRGMYPPVPSTYSKGLRDLISMMIQKNPHARPSIHQILAMPIIKGKYVHPA